MANSASALTLFACSGPGGQAAMAQSITMGHYFAVMSGVVVLALVFDHWRMRRVSLRLVAAIFLMAAHPVWTGEASVRIGDCGQAHREACYIWLAVLLALLLHQIYATRRTSPAASVH